MGILDTTLGTQKTTSAYSNQECVNNSLDVKTVPPITHTVKSKETLWSILDVYFPYMKYDIPGKFRKIDEIVKSNGLPNKDTIEVDQVLIIPVNSTEDEKRKKVLPAELPAAEPEQKGVEQAAKNNHFTMEAVQGSKTTEKDFLAKKHEGWLEFIGHSDSGIAVMQEAYSLNNECEDGYLHADEVKRGDFSGTTGVFTNSCQSSMNIDGNPEWSLGRAFMQAGAPQHIGSVYKVNDDAGKNFGIDFTNRITDPTNHDQVHQAMRDTQLSMIGQYQPRVWSGYKHLSKQYTAEKYGSANSYSEDIATKEGLFDSLQIRQAAKKDPEIMKDRKEYVQNKLALRTINKALRKNPEQGDLAFKKKLMEEENKALKLQMITQRNVNKEPDQKTTEVAKELKVGEAVVEIKAKEAGGSTQYFAFITLPNAAQPKVIALPDHGGVSAGKYVTQHTNQIKFDYPVQQIEESSEIVWGKINAYLKAHQVNRIFFRGEKSFGSLNVNALFLDGKFLIENFDVMYLY